MADPPSSTRLIPHLPDEVSVQIIARIPRSHHRVLCRVSRSWRSFLLRRLLFTLRSSLHCTEPTLCLSICTPTDQSPWMVLNRGLSYSHSLPSPPHPTVGSACATVGPFVFAVGGSLAGGPSDVVQVLDLRIGGQWFQGPRTSTAREFATANFLNGRVYVFGGCLPSSEPWAESLDPFDGNPRWVPIDSPVDLRKKLMHGCVELSGQILAMAAGGGFIYDPGQDTGSTPAWGAVPKQLDLGYLEWRAKAVVNGVLYTYNHMGKIKGYDAGMDNWRTVMGIDEDLPEFLSETETLLVNFNGVLCVIWEQERNERKRKEMVVDWVGIGVTDLGSEGLHGSILWWETVAVGVPCGSVIEHCVVANF